MSAEEIDERLVAPHVDAVRGGRMALEVIDHAHDVAKIFGSARPRVVGIELRRILPPLVEGLVVCHRSHHRAREPKGKHICSNNPGENVRHAPVALGKVTGNSTRAVVRLDDDVCPQDGKEWIARLKVIRLIPDLNSQSGEAARSSREGRRETEKMPPPPGNDDSRHRRAQRPEAQPEFDTTGRPRPIVRDADGRRGGIPRKHFKLLFDEARP